MLICIIPPQVLKDPAVVEKVMVVLRSHHLDPDPLDFRDMNLGVDERRRLIEYLPDQPVPPVQYRSDFRMIRLRCTDKAAAHYLSTVLSSGLEGTSDVERYMGGQLVSRGGPRPNAHLRHLLIVPRTPEQIAFVESCFPTPESRLAA